MANQRWQLAATDFSHSLDLEPHAMAYYQRGLSYQGLGELEKAITDLDKAVKLQPNRPEFYEVQGDIYRLASPQHSSVLQLAAGNLSGVPKESPNLFL